MELHGDEVARQATRELGDRLGALEARVGELEVRAGEAERESVLQALEASRAGRWGARRAVSVRGGTVLVLGLDPSAFGEDGALVDGQLGVSIDDIEGAVMGEFDPSRYAELGAGWRSVASALAAHPRPFEALVGDMPPAAAAALKGSREGPMEQLQGALLRARHPGYLGSDDSRGADMLIERAPGTETLGGVLRLVARVLRARCGRGGRVGLARGRVYLLGGA